MRLEGFEPSEPQRLTDHRERSVSCFRLGSFHGQDLQPRCEQGKGEKVPKLLLRGLPGQPGCSPGVRLGQGIPG